MIVVADTSPLNYLILIGEVDTLPALFGKVLIPEAVAVELQHSRAALKVRRWMEAPPDWMEIHTVQPYSATPSQLFELDPGEREAIELALQLGIDLVLIDERSGRQRARELQLKVRGTVGILEQSARLGKTDLQAALGRLGETNFRLSPTLRKTLLGRPEE